MDSMDGERIIENIVCNSGLGWREKALVLFNLNAVSSCEPKGRGDKSISYYYNHVVYKKSIRKELYLYIHMIVTLGHELFWNSPLGVLSHFFLGY